MVLGRYLGPRPSVGPAMCSKVLKANAHVHYRSTVRALTPDELADPIVQQQMKEFDDYIKTKVGDSSSTEAFADFDGGEDINTPTFEPYEDDEPGEKPSPVPDADNAYAAIAIDDVDVWDGYLNAEVLLPHDGSNQTGRVKERAKAPDGSLTGKANPNPILDTRVYVVEFPDG